MNPKFKIGDLAIIINSPNFPHLIGTQCTVLTLEGYFEAGSIVSPATSRHSFDVSVSGFYYMIGLSKEIITVYGAYREALCGEFRLMKISPDGDELTEDEFHEELLKDEA